MSRSRCSSIPGFFLPLMGLLASSTAVAAAPASGSLELTVQVDGDGIRVLSARPVGSLPDPVQRGNATMELLGADGAGLGAASLPDPRLRSSIAAPGSHDHAHSSVVLERGVVTVRVPWDGRPVPQVTYQGRTVAMPALTVAGSGPLPPPTSAVLLQDSGPPDQRLDMVFLGDGYTASQLDDFAEDVDRMADYLLSIEPYGAYADMFNIWRIDVVSNETGASHFDFGQNDSRDTALGCYYGCGGIDRLTCCDDSAVMSAVNDAVPGADGIMVLINDDTYGGSGGFNYATSYVGRDYGEQVAAHELGHSLIGLWDEYGYGGSGSGDGPNCTSDPGGAWDSWKGTNGVDAYPECSWSNLYRPTAEACMMRTLQDDYCPVCRQEAVLAMYRRLPGLVSSASHDPAEPIDATGTDRGEVVLSVRTNAPASSLSFQWLLDGEVVGENAKLDLSCSNLNGDITLRVEDPTPWVRDDPDGVLRQELGPWSVTSERCAREEVLGCATAPTAAPWALVALLAVLGRRRGSQR